jgi:hypothetical protein
MKRDVGCYCSTEERVETGAKPKFQSHFFS